METILDCGHPVSEHNDITTGYGVDKDGRKHCYACCAEKDKAYMREHGQIALYLSKTSGKWVVCNWPGSLKFENVYVRTGRHNIAGHRYDTWFKFEGFWWHGVTYGDNTEVCHCKRTKERA